MKLFLKISVAVFAAFALALGSAHAGGKGSKGSKGSDYSHKSSKGSKGSHGSKGSKGSHGSKGSRGTVDSCECDGGITMLGLQYNGDSAADIFAYDKDGRELFNGTVSAGGSFPVTGLGRDGKIGSKFFILTDGMNETEIHTSCSEFISVGSIYGDFTVTAGMSRNNGALCITVCPEPPPLPDDDG